MQEPNSPRLYDESLLDEKITVLPDDAIRRTRELAQLEGLFVGMSSGAALHGALQVAESIEEGEIVVIFPDRGEKYLSTPLFDQSVERDEPSAEEQSAAVLVLESALPESAFAFAI